MDESNKMYCGECGHEINIETKCRLRSKSKGHWRCGRCQTHLTQLRRCLGSWPTSAFTTLSAEEKQRFYSELRDASTQAQVQAQHNDFFRSFEKHEDYYADGGEFLPLGVWGQRGFDTDAIEQKSLEQDMKPHPVLGITYRVKIYSAGRQGVRGKERGEGENAQPRESVDALAPAPAAEPEDSESSSSSSSRKKHKKRKSKKQHSSKHAKKNKKGEMEQAKKLETERKEKAKQDLKNQAAKAKFENANWNFATVLQPKLTAMIITFDSVMSNPAFVALPIGAVDRCRQVYQQLQEIQADLNEVLFNANLSHQVRHIDSSKGIKPFLADAKRRIDLVQQLVAMSLK